jgi:hypothetical protein
MSQRAADGQGKVAVYKYGDLPDDRSIRMLTLLPGNLNDPLKGELEFVDIGDAGAYEISLVCLGRLDPYP